MIRLIFRLIKINFNVVYFKLRKTLTVSKFRPIKNIDLENLFSTFRE